MVRRSSCFTVLRKIVWKHATNWSLEKLKMVSINRRVQENFKIIFEPQIKHIRMYEAFLVKIHANIKCCSNTLWTKRFSSLIHFMGNADSLIFKSNNGQPLKMLKKDQLWKPYNYKHVFWKWFAIKTNFCHI